MSLIEMSGDRAERWPVAGEAPETRPLTLLVRVRKGGAEVADDAARPSWRTVEVFASEDQDAGGGGTVPDVSHETGGTEGL